MANFKEAIGASGLFSRNLTEIESNVLRLFFEGGPNTGSAEISQRLGCTPEAVAMAFNRLFEINRRSSNRLELGVEVFGAMMLDLASAGEWQKAAKAVELGVTLAELGALEALVGDPSMTYKEIGSEIGISEKAVGSRIRRAEGRTGWDRWELARLVAGEESAESMDHPLRSYGLNGKHLQVLRLRFGLGLTHAEAATEMEIPKSAVSRLIGESRSSLGAENDLALFNRLKEEGVIDD